jgi:hypothetical protein
MGPRQLRIWLAFAAFCAVHAGVRAQTEAAPAGDIERAVPAAVETIELPGEPPSELQPFAPLPTDTRVEEPLPAEARVDAPVASVEAAPVASADSAPVEAAPVEVVIPADGRGETAELGEAASGIGNADVQAMVEANFADSTIVAVIKANDVQFDLSPRALVALKGAGVSEPVIEAMIAAEAAKQSPATPALPEPTTAQLAETQASLEYARLSAMIEQLAAKQEAAEKAPQAPEPLATRADPAPRVWLVQQTDRAPIAPTIAQVAFAGANRRGERMKNLQGLAGQALAFASPAVSGIATTLGGLFRPDEDRTAVWAISAPQSSRVLDVAPVFEIDYAHIPGVDPDKYQPAIVQLVPTNDNYRLVAAAETEDASMDALPRGPIIEESVATESTRLARGQYRVAPKVALGPGEYALVLRPISEPRRDRRRTSEASLGEMLGGSTSQILYLTWDFSVAGQGVAQAR